MCASVLLQVWVCALLALCAHFVGKMNTAGNSWGKSLGSSKERKVMLPCILHLVA